MKKIFFLLMLISGIARAQTDSSRVFGPAPPIQYSADSLVGRTSPDGTPVRELIGNVQIVQGNVTATSTRAIYYAGENRAELIGNVRVNQGGLTLFAPLVDYNGSSGFAFASGNIRILNENMVILAREGRYNTVSHLVNLRGNVSVEDDSVIIYSDALDHDRDTKNSFAFGDVLLRAKKAPNYLQGDSIAHFPGPKYTRVMGNPLLVQIDSSTVQEKDTVSGRELSRTAYDTLAIAADTMEAYRGAEERYIAIGNVEMTRGMIAARSGRALYDRTQEIIYLRGRPYLWADSTQLRGDSIDVHIPLRRLRNIFAYDSAFAASRDDTLLLDRINQLSGTRISIEIERDTLQNIFASGDAKSLYFAGGGEASDGAARNSADSIRIEMEGGTPARIRWLGAVQGEFLPEAIIGENPKDFYLPNLRLEGGRPEKRFIKHPKLR